jgi:hypothetical protein
MPLCCTSSLRFSPHSTDRVFLIKVDQSIKEDQTRWAARREDDGLRTGGPWGVRLWVFTVHSGTPKALKARDHLETPIERYASHLLPVGEEKKIGFNQSF